MSKKKPNKINDDFDLDSGLDNFKFDDFDFGETKDDRKPITKILSGAKSGMTSTLKSPRFIKDAIKETMPSGYGQTIDFADKSLESLKGLYDESAKELKPAWRATKQTVTRMVPSDSKALPKSIKNLLERWKKEERESVAPGEADRETALASTMQEIFQAQAAQAQQNQAYNETAGKLKEGIEEIRFSSMFAAANATAMATSRIDAYNTGINYRFQKRSLELQYRQLFALQDLHKFHAQDAVRRNELLMAIAKNTGLPDALKIRDSEARAHIQKTKMYESVFGGLYGKRNRYIEKTIAGVKGKVLDGARGLAQGLYSGLSEAEMASMASDMGMDNYEVGGIAAGSLGTEIFGKKAGRWLRDRMAGSNFDKRFGITEKGKRLEGGLANLPNKLNEFRKNGNYRLGDSLKDLLMSGLKDMLPNMGVDKTTRRFTAKDMNSPAVFSRRTDRSINEIIPGYLARIFRELQVTRTGDEKIGLLRFDHDKGNFVNNKDLRKHILGGVLNPSRQAGMKRRVKDLMDMIDPNNELSEEEKKAIKKRLLTNSADVNEASEARLAEHKQYDSKHAKKIVPHMQKFLRGMDTDARNKFQKLHNELASQMGDPRDWIQLQLDMGNGADLVKLGLIDQKTGDINLERIQELYLSGPVTGMQRQAGPRQNAGGFAFGQMASALTPKKSLRQRAKDAAQAAKQTVSEKAEAAKNTKAGQYAMSVKDVVVGKINDAKEIASDIFLDEDTQHPRLRKALLLAGEYRTKFSNQVVRTLEDIKEPIVDSQGNVVVSADELPKLVYYKTEQKLLTYVNKESVARLAENTHAKAKTTKAMLTGAADTFIRELSSKSIGEVAEAADIYIGNEISPTITKTKMLAGHYMDAITEKVITKVDDIKGPIKSVLTGELLVDEDQLKDMRVLNPRTMSLNPINWAGRALGWLGKTAWYLQTKWGPKRAAKNLKFLWKATKMLSKPVGWLLNKTVGSFARGAMAGAGLQLKILDVYSRKTGKVALSARLMKAGSYISKKTGNIIRSLKDIDGPVQDRDTNDEALSQADIDAGLHDVQGQPITLATMSEKLNVAGQKLKGFVKTASGKASAGILSAKEALQDEVKQKKLKNMTMDKLGNSVKGSFEQIRRKFGISRQEVTSIQTEQTLSEMKDAMMHGPQKPRHNSFEELKAQEEKDKAKAGNAKTVVKDAAKKTDDPSWSKVLGLDMLQAGVDGLGKVVGGIAGVAGLFLGKGKLAQLLKLGGAVAEPVIAAGGAALAGQAAAAGGAAAVGAGAGAAAGGTSVLAMIGSGILTAGAATVSFLTSPIVLGAAAVGIAGYGGYKAYKYLTRDKLRAISKLRLVQYGFHPQDTNHYINAIDLERAASKGVVSKNDGTFGFDFNKVSLKDLMSPFGMDYRNANASQTFLIWMKNRFLPVYLTHLTALGHLTKSQDISDIDSLKGADELKMLEMVKLPDGPYDQLLPYGADAQVKSSTGQDVTDAVKAVEFELKVDAAGKKGNSPLMNKVGGDSNFGKGSMAPGRTPAPATPVNGKGSMAPGRQAVAQGAAAASKPVVDGEPKNMTVGKGGSKVDPQASVSKAPTSPGNLVLAGGPIADGRSAGAYLKLAAGVSLDNINPQMKKQFFGMAEEYGQLTGKQVPVTDAFRTFEEQMRMKQMHPDKAAAPGTSMHEFGLAMDVDSKTLDDMDKLGLLRKYGFTRPVGQEPWHLEPIGIQTNLALYKQNQWEASKAIENGIGCGGSGMATYSQAPKNARSAELSQNIMLASVRAEQPNKERAAYSPNSPVLAKVDSDKHPKSLTSVRNATFTAANQSNYTPTVPTSMDGEAKPMAGASISMPAADGSAKVPTPMGAGYAGLKDTITGAAKTVGVDPNLLLTTVAAESDFKPGASPGNTSASGIAQFTDDTWKETLGKYGRLYGFDSSTPQTDSKASALMMAHYYKDNLPGLKSKISRPIGMTEAYMSHLLGPTGAAKFFSLLDKDPNCIPALTMAKAAKNNPNIFTKDGRALTASEIYAGVSMKLASKAKEYGISMDSFTPPGGGTMMASASAPAMGSQSGMRAPSVSPTTVSYTPPIVAKPMTTSASMGAAYGMGQRAALPTIPVDTSMNNPASQDLLGKSVDIQSRMLQVLTSIDGKIGSVGTGNPATNAPVAVQASANGAAGVASQQKLSYQAPSPVVSMKRMGDTRFA